MPIRMEILGAAVRAVALFFLLLLGACAGMMTAGTPRMEGVRTVGIISAVSNKFRVQKIGITVFGNELKDFPIDSWGLDDVMISRARAALAGRFEVRPVTYRKADLAAKGVACFGMADRLRAEVSTQGLDAYILIGSARSQHGNTNQYMYGFGIVELSGGVLRSNRQFVHALYNVFLIDGRTLGCKDWTAAQTVSGTLEALNGPSKQVDQFWWPTSLDAASNPRLKGAMVELIGQSMPATLQKLEQRHLQVGN